MTAPAEPDGAIGTVPMSPALGEMLARTRRSASLTSKTDAISLAIGEPDLAPPRRVIAAMVHALEDGYTHYADFQGDPELREEIAALHSTPSRTYGSDDVLITSGGTAALAATILATTSPGDRVVMPDPTFSLYADLVRLAGGTPVAVTGTADHHLDLAALAAALPGARSFVYCSPVNPTGAVYTREELTALGEILHGTDTLVIDDAAYSALTYDGRAYVSAIDVPSLRERTVLCQTFSKKFAMTGFRIGYVLTPSALLTPIAAVHRTFNGAIGSAVQRAALEAVRLDDTFVDHARVVYAQRMEVVHAMLQDIPQLESVRPEGAFYAYARIATGHTSDEVAAHLLSWGVKVRPGGEFGASGERCIRLSFATSIPLLEQGLERIAKGMATLD